MDNVIVCDHRGTAILTVWRETDGARLYRVALVPSEDKIPSLPPEAQQSTLSAFSATNLLSGEVLVRYFHAAAGFLVWSTWLQAIKSGNYSLWSGLT